MDSVLPVDLRKLIYVCQNLLHDIGAVLRMIWFQDGKPLIDWDSCKLYIPSSAITPMLQER